MRTIAAVNARVPAAVVMRGAAQPTGLLIGPGIERFDAERQHRRDGDATAAFHPADRLAEIGEQVVDVLDADAHADESRRHVCIACVLLTTLHRRLDTTEARRTHDEVRPVAHGVGRIGTATVCVPGS